MAGTLVALILILFSSTASAADVKLRFDPVDGADDYTLQAASIGCVAPSEIQWGDPVSTGGETTFVYPGASDTDLVIFRASAVDASGNTVTHFWAGAWYDERLRPIDAPGGLGIE